MKKVITTVGTSLFTNYMKEEVKESEEFDFGGRYNEPIDGKNGLFRTFDSMGFPLDDDNRDFEDLKSIIQRRWLNKFRQDASAEISSLFKIAEHDDIEVHLLATETALSFAACELIKAYLQSDYNQLKSKFKNIYFDREYVVKGLQVKDAGIFQDNGFINLVEKIIQIKDGYENTVLNISGGYKALIPPLTLLAQLEKMPLFYIYEDSNVPIETGVLPIDFDWSFIENYVELINKDGKRKNEENNEKLQILREKKLVYPDNYDLTILGQLIRKYSNTASPFTLTIFGYFIEYKLFEYYLKEYGPNNVEHSVKAKGSEDIDILITLQDKKIIPVEIKPSTYLDDKSKMQDIAEKIVRRTNTVIETDNREKPSEVWLITYSYTDIKPTPLKSLTDDEKENAEMVAQMVRNAFPEECSFCIKHFFIEQNRLNDERHVYQKFMKSPLKENIVKDIFRK